MFSGVQRITSSLLEDHKVGFEKVSAAAALEVPRALQAQELSLRQLHDAHR